MAISTRVCSSCRIFFAATLVTAFALNAAAQSIDCDQLAWQHESTCCDDAGCDSFIAGHCDGCSCCDQYAAFKSSLAESGITFLGNVTQFYMATVDGGVDQKGRYGGHGDYLANLDLGKLGIHEGLFVKFRAEHRFGNSISGDAGTIFPPTLATELPVSESREIFLTNLVLTQFLSESFAIYGGKLDSLDGDANAYASGRGITQFSNTALIANPIALRTVPYASLGFGFAYFQDGEPLFNFLVINPTDTADSDGFDELFREGVTLSAELRVPTKWLGKPGHQLFAGTWSSRNFVSLGQDPRVILPNTPIARASGSWSLYWNMDQALWVDPCDPSRHWGYFARAGVADDTSNPASYTVNLGLGGSSPIRRGDSFGIGYFYNGVSDEIGPVLQAALGPIADSKGMEVFYRAAVGNGVTISPDFQWLEQAQQNIPDAYLLGCRVNIAF